MGWWGCESDANDDAQDALYILDPESGLTKNKVRDVLESLVPSTRKEIKDSSRTYDWERTAYLGVVRAALQQDVKINKKLLTLGLRVANSLLNDEVHITSFKQVGNHKKRIKCIKDEIGMIKAALSNRRVKKIKTKGLFELFDNL